MKSILKKMAGLAVVAVLALLMFGCSNEVVSHTHTFGTWTSNNDATKNADGTKYRTCSDCSYKETVTDEGTKLPKEVGDFILKDGTVLSKDSTPQSGTVAAVIVRAAADGKPALGVGIVHGKYLTWCKQYTDISNTTEVSGYNTNITAFQVSFHINSIFESGYNINTTALQGDATLGYTDGSNSWDLLVDACEDLKNATAETIETVAQNYPAFNYCRKYGPTNGLEGELANGWYLPTVVELHTIYQNKNIVDTSLSKANGSQFGAGSKLTCFWSCCQAPRPDNRAWVVEFISGRVKSGNYFKSTISDNSYVCAVRAFN